MCFYLSHRVEDCSNSIVSLSLPPRSGLAVPYLEHTAAALSAADSEGGERSASGRSKETISQLKQAFNEANLPLSLNQGEKIPGSFIIYPDCPSIPILAGFSHLLVDSPASRRTSKLDSVNPAHPCIMGHIHG